MPEIQHFKREDFEIDALPEEDVIVDIMLNYGVTREDVIALRRYDTASRYRQNDAITSKEWHEETVKMLNHIKSIREGDKNA